MRPAQRRHAPAHRPVAVGIAAQHRARLAQPAGDRPVGAVLRIAEDRDRRADRAPRALVEGRRAEPRHAQHGNVVVRVEDDRRRVHPVAAVRLHRGVVLTGHDVRVRDDDSGPRHPAGPLHGEAAGVPRTRTTLALRLPARRASRRMRRVGGGNVGRRARGCAGTGRRVRARSGSARTAAAPRSASRGSPSAGCPRAQLSRARRLQRDGARDPHQRQPERGDQHARRRCRRARPRRGTTSGAGSPLPAPRRRSPRAAHHQRGHEAEQRRVGRARSLVEQQRREPAAGERARRRTRPATARSRRGPARSPTAPSARRTRR